MHVRLATKNDINQLSVLFDGYRVFYKQPSDVEKAKAFLSERLRKNESIIVVVEDDHKGLIAFTQLYTTFSSVSLEHFYILNDLFVSEAFRNRGIGKLLLNYAQDLVRKNEYKGISLETAKDNPAQHLYEREGWDKDVDYLHYFWSRKQD